MPDFIVEITWTNRLKITAETSAAAVKAGLAGEGTEIDETINRAVAREAAPTAQERMAELQKHFEREKAKADARRAEEIERQKQKQIEAAKPKENPSNGIPT